MVSSPDPALQLTVETAAAPGRIVVRAVGVLDLQTRDELLAAGAAALAVEPPATVALDLADVSFLDSTGLGSLVSLNNTARRTGRRFVLYRPTARISQLLQLTALDTVLEVEA